MSIFFEISLSTAKSIDEFLAELAAKVVPFDRVRFYMTSDFGSYYVEYSEGKWSAQKLSDASIP